MGANLEKAILINFTKSTGKHFLFFDKVVGLKFKKESGTTVGGTTSAKYPLFVTSTSKSYP